MKRVLLAACLVAACHLAVAPALAQSRPKPAAKPAEKEAPAPSPPPDAPAPYDRDLLRRMTRTVSLEEAGGLAEPLLDGQVRGRTVVAIG